MKGLVGTSIEKLLGIHCSTNSSKNKSKDPKLLFNQSVHFLPINATQTSSSFKQYYVHNKDVVHRSSFRVWGDESNQTHRY